MIYRTIPMIILLTLFMAQLHAQPAVSDAAGQNRQSLLQKETSEHYRKFSLNEILRVYQGLDQNIPQTLNILQTMLDQFYREYPGSPLQESDINLDVTLERQLDPGYKIDARKKAALERMRQKQSPGLIKNAPNIFELHYAMARALRKAEKNDALFSKNSLRAGHYFLEAMKYRTLRLSPQVWTDPERLDLLGDENEKKDAMEFLRISTELSAAREKLIVERRKLFSGEDNAVSGLKDPGVNDPVYNQNKKTLEDLEKNISALENEMDQQQKKFDVYAEKYNRQSASFLIDFADVVNTIENNLNDREKILNAVEFYRSSYNETFKQNWKLDSRKLAFIDLLEMATALDPGNPLSSFVLGREYMKLDEKILAISSFENSLRSNEQSSRKLGQGEELELYNNLGGLYYATNRFVDSSYFYEKVLTIQNTPERAYQLAKIMTEKTGDYERADVLLKSIFQQEPEQFSSIDQQTGFLRNKFRILELQMTIYTKKQSREELLSTLKQSIEIHRILENLTSQNYDLLRDKEKTMVRCRFELDVSPDEKTLQAFYDARQNYDDQKSNIQTLESVKKSMNFAKIYFTMADQYEIIHDYAAAIEAWRTAEAFGFEPDRARKEILRLQKKFE